MAVPVLSPSSYGRLKSQINQYRASTGRDMSPGMIQSLLEAEIKQQAGRATEEARFELATKETEQAQKNFETNVIMQREQQEQANRAARTSGIVQLGQTAITGGLLLGQTEFGKQAFSAIGSKASEVFGLGQAAAATSGGGSALSAGFSPSLMAEYGALETAGVEGVSAGAGAGAGAAAAPGFLGVAGPAALGGFVGGKILKNEPKLGGAIGGAAAGAAAAAGTSFGASIVGGAAAGGPVGAVIGAIVGVFSGGGSIICTELNRQGLLDTRLLKLAGLYRSRFHDQQTYDGYMRWARPVAQKMRTNKLLTSIMRPIAVCWCLEMAHRLLPERYPSSLVGRLVDKIAIPICKFLGRRV